jgi:uncharacterized repeat protein (TIGR03843 family)
VALPPSDIPPEDEQPDDQQPFVNPPLAIPEVLSLLETGAISTVHGLIANSSNYTFLLTLTDESGTEGIAVYKPRRGERPLWDFPDGTLYARERAAFLLSAALGWDVVPPTVVRDGPNGVGSFQWFITHNPQEHYFTFGERPDLSAQIQRLAAFDLITNNADRKGGHCLLDSQGHVWGIDHGLTFNVAHKLRTVIWDFAGQPIPPSFLEDLEALHAAMCDESHAYTGEMRTLLEHDEMTAFLHRVERLLKTRMYPRPGPGPNYPWPPV